MAFLCNKINRELDMYLTKLKMSMNRIIPTHVY